MDITGIVQVSLAVSDLSRSAAFYRDALGLTYAREFGDADQVSGCALADFHTGYLIALRRRDTTQGGGDMRGEHPVIVGVADRPALDRIFDRLAGRGFDPARASTPTRPASRSSTRTASAPGSPWPTPSRSSSAFCRTASTPPRAWSCPLRRDGTRDNST
jgi:catechol 2,3-dioxygenase-like lactoylglutathione lyase family enzyme